MQCSILAALHSPPHTPCANIPQGRTRGAHVDTASGNGGLPPSICKSLSNLCTRWPRAYLYPVLLWGRTSTLTSNNLVRIVELFPMAARVDERSVSYGRTLRRLQVVTNIDAPTPKWAAMCWKHRVQPSKFAPLHLNGQHCVQGFPNILSGRY